ncbi:MAG: PhoH family protein [Candidatus Hydrogenedentota bacterium]
MGSTLTHELTLRNQDEAIKLLGRNGELRKCIQREAAVRIVDRGTKVAVLGEAHEAELVGRILNDLLASVRQGHTPTVDEVAYALDRARNAPSGQAPHIIGELSPVLRKDIFIKPRTAGQKAYLDAIRTHELVLAIGPAGTGKTYLAMAAAVSALLNKEVNRLVLTRPAVEAGENLGFLPGDLREKVNPYLRPLYDALYSMVDADRVRKLFEREQIEVAPLAFMRGRTLNNCFAVLDEAQNTTPQQMKMFLTRLGEGSRAIITGDITQVDLPATILSGLVDAERVLRSTEGISVVRLDRGDVVRHRLVQNIVEAYESDEQAALRNNAKDPAMSTSQLGPSNGPPDSAE